MSKKTNQLDPLNKRVLSALVMVPAGLFSVYFGGTVLALIALCVGIAMWLEYVRVITGGTLSLLSYLGCFSFVLSFLCGLFLETSLLPAVFFVLSLVAGLVAILVAHTNKVWTGVGLFLILTAVQNLQLLRNIETSGLVLVLSIMGLVWATDISAYFAGKGFGGPRLSPTGSPNKTWSGAIAAVICSGLISVLIAGLLNAPVIAWLVFGLSISFVAQFGDLMQSFWKRRFKMKDSGSIIPGHGGVLDRLDSFSGVLILIGSFIVFCPSFTRAILEI